MRRTSGSFIRSLTVLLIAAVVAAGCFDAGLDVTVHEDGGVSSQTSLVVHDELLALGLLAEEGSSLREVCDTLLSEFSDGPSASADGATGPAGALGFAEFVDEALPAPVVEHVNDGETCAITETHAWSPQMSERLIGVDDFPLSRTEDDGWRFVLDLDNDEPAGSDEDIDELQALGVSLPTVQVTVTLPGYAHSHNATAVEASTFTWRFTIADMPAEPLFAQTSLTETMPRDPNGDESEHTSPVVTEGEADPDNASALAEVPQLPAPEIESGNETSAGLPTGTTAAVQSDDPSAANPAEGGLNTGWIIVLILLAVAVLPAAVKLVHRRWMDRRVLGHDKTSN